jgi:ribose transport system substrate-binding protein
MVAVLFAAVSLAACGSSSSSTSSAATSSSSAGASSTSASGSSTASSGSSGGKYTIAVVPKSVGLFYWGTVHAGAAAAAKALGVNIIWKGTETETDVSGQVNILQDFINRHVSGIAFAATDAHGLVGTAQAAANNIAAAAKAADILAQQIGDKGDVALLPFVPSAATSIQRQQGFEQEIKKYPNIHLVAVQYDQSDINTALSEMENILTSHPNLKGVFAANEPGVIGVVHALLERGLVGKVKVIGFDNAPDEVSALAQGQVSALIVQDPYKIGYQGVAEVVALLQHKTVPHSLDTGAVVATKANMNQPAIHKLLVPPTLG